MDKRSTPTMGEVTEELTTRNFLVVEDQDGERYGEELDEDGDLIEQVANIAETIIIAEPGELLRYGVLRATDRGEARRRRNALEHTYRMPSEETAS